MVAKLREVDVQIQRIQASLTGDLYFVFQIVDQIGALVMEIPEDELLNMWQEKLYDGLFLFCSNV